MDSALSLYDFELPQDRIAQYPAERRDASRLMVLRGEEAVLHHSFADLPELLQPGDVLVRNDTRVIPARLRGKRPGGGKMEVLLTHRLEAHGGAERWVCLGRPTSHLKPDKPIVFGDGVLTGVLEEKRGAGVVVMRFPDVSAAHFMKILDTIGEIPLPPYIGRGEDGPDALDRDRYQTTYAKEAGAVAAPTAGLHFTPEIEKCLRERGVELQHVTLHVGPGTFRPIKVDSLDEHVMDSEFYRVSESVASSLTAARAEGRRIIAVGTTSTRTLESVTDAQGVTHAGEGWTDLFIRPGYCWRGIDGLLTNFHLPRSSLLVLVSALAGRERVLAAYREAVERQYRFYSYGDAMLILPQG